MWPGGSRVRSSEGETSLPSLSSGSKTHLVSLQRRGPSLWTSLHKHTHTCVNTDVHKKPLWSIWTVLNKSVLISADVYLRLKLPEFSNDGGKKPYAWKDEAPTTQKMLKALTLVLLKGKPGSWDAFEQGFIPHQRTTNHSQVRTAQSTTSAVKNRLAKEARVACLQPLTAHKRCARMKYVPACCLVYLSALLSRCFAPQRHNYQSVSWQNMLLLSLRIATLLTIIFKSIWNWRE